MPRNGSGVYSLPPGSTVTNGDTSDATDLNTPLADLETDLNTARPIVAGGTGATSASAARTNLGLAIGTNVQAYDAGLASIAGLTTAADKMIYTTASDVYAVADLTAAGRALLDDADAAAQRTTLGLGNIATTDLIDEDDMASDLDTRAPTQQSVKAYVDAQSWTTAGPTVTTSGTAIDFTSIPSGVDQVEIVFNEVSLDGTDNILIQLSTSATFVTTGYVSSSHSTSANPSSTAGFIIATGAAANTLTGTMSLQRAPGTNTWISVHTGKLSATTNIYGGGGVIALAGAMDGIRLTRTGTNNFDAGSVFLRYL